MGLMSFPRYIKREARDYFYMTLRQVLPGPALVPGVSPPSDGEGKWRMKGLPQHGFPYAMALTELRPEAARPDARVRVLAMDPRMVLASSGGSGSPAKAAGAGAGAEKTVAIIGAGAAGPTSGGAGAAGDAVSLWHSAGAFSIADAAPVAGAVRLATGSSSAGGAVAAAGVRDEDGTLLYVELMQPPAVPSVADARLLEGLLKRIGCSARLLLPAALPIALGGDTDLGGAAVHPPSGPSAVRLLRAQAAGAQRIFEDTPVVPFDHWYKLQQHRIRYFKKPKSEKADDATGDESN